MSARPNEDCPVCWRSFSLDLVPFSIPCGHSFCNECSLSITRCPLCRKRLVQGYPRVKNFSLLSLIERLCTPKAEFKDQQIQTEYSLPVKRRIKPKEDLPMTLEQMATKPLNLKFHKDSLGNIRRLEIKFK